jgi:hypothetical protein
MRKGLLVGFALALSTSMLAGTAGCRMLSRAEPDGTAAAASPAPERYRETPPATRYRVARDSLVVAPTGNDRNPGTLTRPLRTVAAAVGKAVAGQPVVLRAGTYRESLGVVRKRLVLQPYPGEQVWLKGSMVVGDWRREGTGWRHDDWSPDLCRTCFLPSIIDPDAPLAGSPDMVFVDGARLTQVATAKQLRAGTFRVDPARKVLWLGSNPTGHTVEATALDMFVQLDTGAEGSVIQGLGIAHYGSNQEYGNRGAMVVINAARVTVRDSVLLSSASSGAAVFQPDVVVQRSVFAHNGLVGLVANRAHRLRFEGNTASDNNVERFALTGDAVGAGGVKIAHTKQPYVADNVFLRNRGNGWWCDLGCSDAVVVRNLAEGNAVNGLYYEVSSRAIIASNVLRGNRLRGLKVSGSDRVRVWSNTFLANGIALGIYGDPRDASTDPYSAALGQSWRPVDLEVANNLFASADKSDQPYLVTEEQRPYRTTASQMLARADGNVYVRGRDGLPRAIVAWWWRPGVVTEYESVLDVLGATGRERHGSEGAAAPAELFTAPDHGDLTLRAGAPGVHAGVPLPADIARAIGVPVTQQPNAGILAPVRR